jgi:hypothetical protein
MFSYVIPCSSSQVICNVLLMLTFLLFQAYANSYGGTGNETFGPESPYFPFGNAPRRPPATGKCFLKKIHRYWAKAFLCVYFLVVHRSSLWFLREGGEICV